MSYAYLIGWSKHNKYYYGIRYAKDCQPSDLWETYFTSSKYVSDFREQFGEPDITQIRKTFSEENQCREWEHKVLRRMGVINNDNFLNKTDNISFPIMRGVEHPRYGKTFVFSAEHKDNMSKSMRGRVGSFTGLKHSAETKRLISEKKRQRKKLTCERCAKIISEGNYYRWHGKNCGKTLSSGTGKMITLNNKNKTYTSIKAAVEETGLSRYLINKITKGET